MERGEEGKRGKGWRVKRGKGWRGVKRGREVRDGG